MASEPHHPIEEGASGWRLAMLNSRTLRWKSEVITQRFEEAVRSAKERPLGEAAMWVKGPPLDSCWCFG